METTDIIGVVLGEFHLNIKILPPQSGQSDSESRVDKLGPCEPMFKPFFKKLRFQIMSQWIICQQIIYCNFLYQLGIFII